MEILCFILVGNQIILTSLAQYDCIVRNFLERLASFYNFIADISKLSEFVNAQLFNLYILFVKKLIYIL